MTDTEKKVAQMKAPKKPTQGDALAKIVETDGPITASALANKGRIGAARNVASMLKPHITSGRILTRYGYDEASGRELKHFMTPAQAEKWGEKAQQADGGEVASNADAEATGEIPAFLLKRPCESTAESATAFFDFGELSINASGQLHITLADNSIVALPPSDTARLGRFIVGTQGVWQPAQ